MADKWKDHGYSGSAYNWFDMLPGGHEHVVENLETGEFHKVWVHDDQDVGEAIENGQFRD